MTKRKTNNPRYSMIFRKASLKDRFHMSYEKQIDGCWKWVGTLHTTGYGIIAYEKKTYLAHRISCSLHGLNPIGRCVLHRCDNRKCVNPDHLFFGTRVQNAQDRNEKERHAFGKKHGNYIHGKYVNQARWRVRPDGSRYFYNGNKERG